jgi:2-aminoadipate transaminase
MSNKLRSADLDQYEQILSRMGRALRPNAIRKLTALLGRGDVISLAAGAPAAETFPQEALAEIAARVIREKGRFALQYGPTRGQSSLVEKVVETMRDRGVEKAAETQVVMTTGSQQGLDLISRVILDPGDVVIVELPSYIGGTIALYNAGAEMVGVRQDDFGIDIDDLKARLEELRTSGRRVKCIYTISNFQNPSGVTLSAGRRSQLVEMADRYDLLIIEDDPYYELYFSGEPPAVAPLAALRPDRVIYLSSYSKVLAPGLRTAWVFAPEGIASKIELAKEGADLSSSVLDQAIVAEALRSGLVEGRLPELRKFYEVRCHAMLDALTSYAPKTARWTRPLGGFFVLLEAADDIDTTELLPAAIESGVAYVPGQPFFVDSSGANTLRLAFSKEPPERISEGIRLLCRLLG